MTSRDTDRFERAALVRVLVGLPFVLLALGLGVAFFAAVVWGGICGALGL